MRAFRPSRMAPVDGDTEDPIDEIVKISQILSYRKRAAAHLPLFEEEAKASSLLVAAEKSPALQT